VRIRRPLDFLVISDHAYALGVMASVQTGDPVLRQSEVGRRLYEMYLADDRDVRNQVDHLWRDIGGAFHQTIWNRVVAAAEEFNDPGTFTTLPGTNGRPAAATRMPTLLAPVTATRRSPMGSAALSTEW